MVMGFHLILSAYGFWLPNDPRGSWSSTIRAFALLRHGPATKVSTSRSLASASHDRTLREEAKERLAHPPVRFTGLQARAIARDFAKAAGERDHRVHALAILPDHVHLVLGRVERDVTQVAAHLKARATQRLSREGLHPLASEAAGDGRLPSPWTRGYWCPFISTREQMRTAIDYVNENPVKAGLRKQRWRLVTPVVW
jgi:REP-associated tyrosine transposase